MPLVAGHDVRDEVRRWVAGAAWIAQREPPEQHKPRLA